MKTRQLVQRRVMQICQSHCNQLPVPLVSSGYRHPSPTTVARTVRILHTLLALISKHLKCDKFEVNIHSVAYLAGM